MKLRLAAPEALVDIGRVAELRASRAAAASVRDRRADHPRRARGVGRRARRRAPALAEAAAPSAIPQVRNRGTIGGNVAHADPGVRSARPCSSRWARTSSRRPPGERTIAADEFFTGHDGDGARRGRDPGGDRAGGTAGQGAAYVKFAHPASRYAVIGVAALVTVQAAAARRCEWRSAAWCRRPVRAAAVEQALTGRAPTPRPSRPPPRRRPRDLGDDVTRRPLRVGRIPRRTLVAGVRRSAPWPRRCARARA